VPKTQEVERTARAARRRRWWWPRPEAPEAPQVAADEPPPGPAHRGAQLDAVLTELYPTVAPRVLALARAGGDADVDEWVTVARLLYDAHMHRVGGASVEARQRALLASLGRALEAQARSSARLAGYDDDALDRPSTIDGDAPGTLVWEHYLCGPARLARRALHGEAVGDWLGALGALWSASDALHALAERVEEPDDELRAALERTKVALVRVQELSLW
jgi:hypothetical protein